jgi:L-alanine-DL-glutamate epimerase-like enolase superfamily enzyme
VKLDAYVRNVRWRTPLRAAHATDILAPMAPRPLVLVRIQAADGAVGYGEAAPLADYDGVTLEAVLDALGLYERVLVAGAGLSHAELLADCTAVAPLPQALAAIDLALWDMAGQRAGQPIWELLGADVAPIVELNSAIGAEDPGRAATEAHRAVERGIGCVKVKVGVADDLARVRAVRAAVGPPGRRRGGARRA